MKPSLAHRLGNLALLAGTLLVLLGVIEITLRLSGFSYVLYPEDIEFGRPDPVELEIVFREDDDLFWVTPDYFDKLERLRREHPRILFLGDSCTQLGDYDRRLVELLAERHGTRVSHGNLGVAGWSSYQGRRQLERDVVPLRPEVVTLYYGWNDHWIGFGIDDANVARLKRIFSSRWSGLRVVQLLTKALVAYGARETSYPNRVSLADFAANLRAMVRQARAAGIRPLVLTAPSSHRRGNEPPELAARWLRDLSQLVPLHLSYVETARRVAGEEGAPLCDLFARFAELPRGELERSFMADGIHLTAAGNQHLAEVLYGCLEEAGLIEVLIE